MRTTPVLPLVATGVAAALLASAASAFDASAVRKEIDEMNQSLPAMVSPVLREEPIRFDGKSLMYTFTRVGETRAKDLDATARAYLLRQLCGDAETRQMMRDGLTFTFTYVDEAKTPATGTVVGDRDCAAPSK